MRKTIIIAALIAGLTGAGNAQISGYMGKRFSVHYSFNAIPNVFGFEGNRNVPVYMQHEGYISYVINRHISIEGGYAFHRSKIDMQGLVTETYNDYYNGLTTYKTPFSYSGKMTVNEGFVNVKIFQRRRGYFPPFGRYGKFGIGIAHVKTVNSAGDGVFLGETLPNYNDVIFRLGIGRQFVIANRLTIDYGFDVSVPLVSVGKIINNDRSDYTYYTTNSAGLISYTPNDLTVGNKMLSLYLMQVHVGIGFLAF